MSSNIPNSDYPMNTVKINVSVDLTFGILSIGIILNLLCVIVFAKLLRANKYIKSMQSIKFLFYKSIIDFIYCIIRLFYQSTECHPGCSLAQNYLFQIVRLVLIYYIGFTMPLFSVGLEILANLDRLLVITNHGEYSKLLGSKLLITAFSFLFSAFYVFKLFESNIVTDLDLKTNRTFYAIKPSQLVLFDYFRFAHSLNRDLLCVIVIFIINILLLQNFKKLMHKKIEFQKNRQRKENLTNRKENKLTLMIVVSGFVCIIGHLPIFIRYVPISLVKEFIAQNDWFLRIIENFLFFSLSINFFVYLIFDSYFKKSFLDIFCAYR